MTDMLRGPTPSGSPLAVPSPHLLPPPLRPPSVDLHALDDDPVDVSRLLHGEVLVPRSGNLEVHPVERRFGRPGVGPRDILERDDGHAPRAHPIRVAARGALSSSPPSSVASSLRRPACPRRRPRRCLSPAPR